MTSENDELAWAHAACLEHNGTNPAVFLESLFEMPECVAFGPMHHFLLGASLLTCYSNALGDDKKALAANLDTLRTRSSAVPGAACALWGVCGAAVSAGMAYAIVAQNAPLKAEGWGEGQLMVSNIEQAIVAAGSPRCCKRDSRIAIDIATKVFEHDFGVVFDHASRPEKPCIVASKNTVCLHDECPFFHGSAS